MSDDLKTTIGHSGPCVLVDGDRHPYLCGACTEHSPSLRVALDTARARVAELEKALRACRAGDGCLCSGGPYDPGHVHSARCLAWQKAIGAATPWDLPSVFSGAD